MERDWVLIYLRPETMELIKKHRRGSESWSDTIERIARAVSDRTKK
jgi:hypothetical protein